MAWPLTARAQDAERVRRLGVLIAFLDYDPEGQDSVAALRQGLQELGWIEGRNLKISYRWIATGSDYITPNDAVALVALDPDVIVAGPSSALAVLRPETHIPIVFVQVTDPVGRGFVANLDHPGSNMTGFAQFDYSVGARCLELLKQIAPSVERVAIIYDASNPNSENYTPVIDRVAKSFGIETRHHAIRSAQEIERTLAGIAAVPNSAVFPLPGPLIISRRDQIIALMIRLRLPNVYSSRYYPLDGALASYGISSRELYRRAASYVNRILHGDKPANLPVQQATKFELVINLKAAKTLGLSIPETVIASADEVIE